MRFLSAALVLCALGLQAAPEIRFDQPGGKNWESEGLPIGNGRLGAMLFSGVGSDRIQFNEESLWTGGPNPSGGWTPEGQDHNSFGSYQSFGDLFVELSNGELEITAEQAAREYFGSALGNDNGEGPAAATDGNPQKKWCLEHKGKPVIWQVKLPKAATLNSYALTSANDVPGRDPSTWNFEGSNDGMKWTNLDEHKDEAPFAERHLRKEFKVAKPAAFSHYRLVFKPSKETHFQIGEIELPGIDFPAAGKAPSGYSRQLDLGTGLHSCDFVKDGVKYHREAFVSQASQCIVLRYTADKKGALSGKIRLVDAHGVESKSTHQQLIAAGKLKNDLSFASGVRALSDGGSLTLDGAELKFVSCDSLTLFLAARTDYALDVSKNCRNGQDPVAVLNRDLAAAAKPFDQLKSAALAETASYMNRVKIELGDSPDEVKAMATPARLKRYREGQPDVDLEETLFAYGRYLMQASSRPGDLPANLQGIWNNRITNVPWASDYHTNINIQMNYWGMEAAKLGDCHSSLIDFIDKLQQPRRDATHSDKKQFGADADKLPGWTCRTSENIFGGQGWDWNIPASAWYAQHVWERYSFSADKDYLRKTGYPILKEVSQFWLAHLKTQADGSLVAPHGWSPEHGPREDGVMHDQQIIWDLFQNTVEAADALASDKAFRDQVAAAQAKLAPNKIGKWGQLQEWQIDRDDENDQHRHTSQLFAVFPGRQISLSKTPELAQAAILSLRSRSGNYGKNKDKPFTVASTIGDSRRSWTWAWRGAMWARLGEADKAHTMIQGLITFNMLDNMFATHPPFQIDGNLGILATYCECLVQSHTAELQLLPALPSAWPSGSVSSLCARGGLEVDLVWKDGKLLSSTIKNTGKEAVSRSVVCAGRKQEIKLAAGESKNLSW